MVTFLVFILKVYKNVVSPLLGNNCRFYPACSDYAADSVRNHGAIRGGTLAIQRICKCHPWNPGGFDPSPKKQSK